MKGILTLLAMLVVVFGLANVAESTLIDRGGGLIYDSDLNLTWLQDADYADTAGYDDLLYGIDTDGTMYWGDAVNWANSLVYQSGSSRITVGPSVVRAGGAVGSAAPWGQT
jgi:hypothetical protein